MSEQSQSTRHIDVPVEAVEACLGETYYWFEGEVIAAASIATEWSTQPTQSPLP